MSTHALLGATGATGFAVLYYLLSSETEGFQLHVLVRSKSKLLTLFPRLEEDKRIRIFQADLDDFGALKECLENTDVIYNCIAPKEIRKGVNVGRRVADVIVGVLNGLREEQSEGYKPPLLIQNRSMALSPSFAGQGTKLMESVAGFALKYLFDDLRAACDMYKSAAAESPCLFMYVFVDPPGLHDPYGTERTGYELVRSGKLNPALSYADLGEAFVEVARRKEEFANDAVGVSATGKVEESPGRLLKFLLEGLWSRLFPV